MLTFFHSPGSCSTGILILLNEVEASFATEVVNVREGQQFSLDYLLKNPKGKVPALMLEDGSVLTEFQTIAYWLANAYPAAGLWPQDVYAQARALEILDFIVGSVHMRGFTFVKVPGKFHNEFEVQQAIQEHGRREVAKGLNILSGTLGEKDFICGDFGVADAALFYVLDWAEAERFDLPENLARCLARLRRRESVIRALG